MGQEPVTTVTCAKCGHPLPAVYANRKDNPPCSECGSLELSVLLEFHDSVNVEAHDTMRGKVKDPALPSTDKLRVDVFAGDDLRKRDGAWMKKERVLDRDRDHYKEVVIDPATGETIHQCEEPLSKHLDHGSAKKKQ
jgi:hypothetical protein